MDMEQTLAKELIPHKAVIIYRRRSAEERHEHEAAYMEIHPIVAQQERFVLGPGTPLTKRQILKIASLAVARSESLLGGFLPPDGRVLYCDPSPAKARLIWWRPPEVRELLFDEKLSGIPSGSYPLPALVFDLNDNGLSVYASCDKKVDLSTMLRHAPLPNIYDNGSVCLGNCKTPPLRGDITTIIAAYEKIFYRSEFTHFNNNQPTRKPIVQLFKSLADKPRFPVEELVPSGRHTIKHLIERNTP